ncbi:MAG TPA: tetratricopeptide repeat protein [Burkholderiales bacterium]|nr:tetratricopeptide repeat protein [Burkholderiales bacterium]
MTPYRFGILAVLIVSFGGGICTGMVWADDYQDAARLFKDGKRADALDRVNAFLTQHPKDARARFLKGVILTEQGKTEDAIKVFTELTQDYPELPEPYNNLAVLYAGQGDYQKARKALEMAIRTHPSYAIAHENLGDIYATLASQAYDKALQLDSSNATARKKLALIKELVPTNSAAILARAEPDKPIVPPVSKPDAQQVSPAPKPAEQPTEAKPGGEKGPADGDATDAVVKMLEGWARAWSNNDAGAYLSFYAPDFVTPNGEARKDWEAARRQRLAKPRKIKVTATSPRVKFADNTHAVVTFRQSYSSANLKAVGTKSLKVVRLGDRWLIQQELIDK